MSIHVAVGSRTAGEVLESPYSAPLGIDIFLHNKLALILLSEILSQKSDFGHMQLN